MQFPEGCERRQYFLAVVKLKFAGVQERGWVDGWHGEPEPLDYGAVRLKLMNVGVGEANHVLLEVDPDVSSLGDAR